MNIKKRHIILASVFVVYFALRLYFSLQTPYFNSEYSYFALRQIDNILETGKPLIHDNLSYGGRTFVFMPFYFYLLAFFALIFPKIIIIKIINSLLASSIVLAVYLVASIVIQKRKISLICSVVAAFLPIYISETLNNISPYSIIFPGSFFLLYLFMKLDKDKKLTNYIVALSIILILTSSSTFVFILSLLLFLFLTYLENDPVTQIESEFISFMLLFFLWVNFIIYKLAFQEHGLSIIWSNLPSAITSNYYRNISPLDIFASIGLLPFVFGSYTIYNYLFKKKSKNILLFISLFIASFILLWLKLISAELGLMFVGSSLVILFGRFLKDFFANLSKVKFAKKENLLFYVVLFVLLLSQVIPGINSIVTNSNKVYDEETIQAYKWLNNTPEESIIFSLPDEGNIIAYFGKRKNVLDTNYLLIKDSETRMEDVLSFYNQRFKISAIRILEKYDAKYFIVSENMKKYNIEESPLFEDPCFELEYEGKIKIYKLEKRCEIQDET